MTPRLVATAAELRALGRRSGPRAVVPTMGALHDGHAELIRSARREVGPEGSVVVTIFVNPTQFAAGEDYSRYPRTLEHDLLTCDAAGADTVLVPDVQEVYGNAEGFTSDSVTVDPGPLGDILEGAIRPDHFRGVLTVVAKIFGLTTPDVALFGEKDFQQLVMIRRMVRDLSMPVAVLGVQTVREADSLARSSRNRYLDDRERAVAVAVPRALAAVAATVDRGVQAALAAGREVVAAQPGIDLDYLVVTDPELGPAPSSGPARALIAARVGSTRLIDNVPVTVGP